MARYIRIPNKTELPPGPVRDFVEFLFEFYRQAHRPPLRVISRTISQREDLAGTASTETIRKMLRGTTVPAHWETVEALFAALCDLAGVDPHLRVTINDREASAQTHLENLWHKALDEPEGRSKDPWAPGAVI